MSTQIEHLIAAFNNGWTQGKFDDIKPLLHDNVIFVAPDLKTQINGKDPCIQTIKDYSRNAKTKVFEIRSKEIHIWNQTTVVTIDFYIEYEMNKEVYIEKGKEFWTLNMQNDHWKLVWRAMVKNERIE